MEALFALLLTNISKFLNYLNINIRLQNKIMTIISIFPTLYILRIVRGYFRNQNYIKGFIYLAIFIVLVYFIILNFIYYFKNKKVKWDVTNMIEDIVPEDVTFDLDPNERGKLESNAGIQGEKVPLIFAEDSPIIIEQVIDELIETGKITTQNLETHNYLISKYTLIPFYKIREKALFIGSNYENMREVAQLDLANMSEPVIPLGVFILGGTYQVNEIIYKEPYTIELRVKEEEKKEDLQGMTRSAKNKKLK